MDDVKLVYLDFDRCGVRVNGVLYELRRDRKEDLDQELLDKDADEVAADQTTESTK